LRDSLLDLVGHTVAPLTLAMLEEHLSPYSNVLEEARQRPFDANATLEEDIRLRLQRRLRELHDVQSALIDRNLHIVPTTARKYRHVGVPWEDLIQEGNTSLLRAVERYNRAEGVRFASYASWWVQQGILKALSFQSRTVRLPVYLAQALHRVRDVTSNAEGNLTIEQIAVKTNLTPDRVERAQRADRQCLSLNRSATNQDDESGFADLLPDLRDIPLPDCPTSAELRSKLEDLLDRLPAREALVLRMRFGFEDGTPKTLEEVRIRLGVSRERVRQLQAQSLRRLARPAPKKELHRFV
jgi:RNA polymerase primary sigma factor